MSMHLNGLVEHMKKIFADDDVNIEEVEKILLSYKSNIREWSKFAIFDERHYTRNLVDTGNGKYNMILLCWGPGMCTNIHDHSDSHCFVKMLQGELLETRFAWPESEDSVAPLTKISEVKVGENDVSYMNERLIPIFHKMWSKDEIGLHRMENPSHTEPAVSLHIYSPAYSKCFLFDQRTSQKHVSKVTFWSKFGKKVDDNNDIPFDPISTCSRRG